MFPSNLHKNILQLDKQISLLENECKNLEMEKKKKPNYPSKCSKLSNPKLSPFKGPMRKTGSENLKKTKKNTPPFSARVHSVSSLQSNYSKPWSEIIEPLGERKTKQRGINTKPHVFPVHVSDIGDNQCKSGKSCKNESSECKDLKPVENNCGDNNKEQILHKEVVFSNSGEAIEVTVTKKLSNVDHKKPSVNEKTSNFENFNNSNHNLKEPKWSEILSLEPIRKKDSNTGNSLKQNIVDEIQANSCRIMQILNTKGSNTNTKEKTLESNFEIPEKLVCQPSKVKKTSNIHKPEKEIQCQLDNFETEKINSRTDNSIPIKVLRSLISELEQKPSKDKKKLLSEMEFLLSELTQDDDESLIQPVIDVTKNEVSVKPSSQQNEMYNGMKDHCENLMKEKKFLEEDLISRNQTIAEMKKREEEYLSLIASLKLNLEKTKENAQNGVKALQELGIIKRKFLEQMKVSEALKKSYSKLQEIMQRCILENDKLKTQVQIYKLESQKHDVLLAGKEAEIKRYREELENFQRQISDHLASLKSNAQAVDFEKVMEAIIQQSHIFTHNDSDSFMTEKNERESSKQCNGLLHSSPTSRRNSDVNSSWKQISSIADQDQSMPNSNLFANLNNSHEKEFIQVYGEDDSVHMNGTLIEKASDNEKKRSSSFTSCISVHDDNDCGNSSASIVPSKENQVAESEPHEPLSSKKVQSSIDELLKNMKLNWSKKVQENSPDNCTIDDFLNNSQISSISVLSENTQFSKKAKKISK